MQIGHVTPLIIEAKGPQPVVSLSLSPPLPNPNAIHTVLPIHPRSAPRGHLQGRAPPARRTRPPTTQRALTGPAAATKSCAHTPMHRIVHSATFIVRWGYTSLIDLVVSKTRASLHLQSTTCLYRGSHHRPTRVCPGKQNKTLS